MFDKVLIAEDHQLTSLSLARTISDLGIPKVQYTYYCDDALMQIKKAVEEHSPFELLITDLSFAEDHREQRIKEGAELIAAVRIIQPTIKILVFSGESRPKVISKLYSDLNINGYVRKARHDAHDLNQALHTISKGKVYLPVQLRTQIKHSNNYEFSNLDITIVSQLSMGIKQNKIPEYLTANNIKPSGLSSIEKRLSAMREGLGFSNNEQLIAHCKDLGII